MGVKLTCYYGGATAGIIRTTSVVYNFYPIRCAVCEICIRTTVFKQETATARSSATCN